MPFDPTTLTLEGVSSWLVTPEGLKANRAYWDGDHWQDGAAWKAVLPDANDNPERRKQEKQRIEAAFTSQNLIRKVTERHLDGVIGRRPRMSFPVGDEASETAEQQADALNDLWSELVEDRGVQDTLRSFARALLLGKRASLRLWIPPGRLDLDEDSGTYRPPSGLSFEDALDLIHLEVVHPSRGTVHTDTWEMEDVAVYGWSLPGDNERGRVEYSYLDADGRTVFGQLIEPEQAEARSEPYRVESDPLDLGGNLHLHEGERRQLVTEQVRQQQDTINKALTMSDTNLDWSGFTERIFLNAQRPVKERRRDDGTTEYVPAPYMTGPGTTAFLTGVTQEQGDGQEQIKNPSVEFREPTSPETFEGTKDMHARALYDEAQQLHVLMNSDSDVSGWSRVQAREDFRNSLRTTQQTLDGAGHWMMRTWIRYADAVAESNEYREAVDTAMASFATIVDTGPLTTDEMNVLIERVDKGQISLRTALSKAGIEDVEQELRRIENQPIRTREDRQTLAEILRTMTKAGVDLRGAALAAGFDEDMADRLVRVGVPTVEQ